MGFDQLAPIYRLMEILLAGDLLQRARLQWVRALPPPRCVLLAGEGTGRFLEAAVPLWRETQFCVVDASEGMIVQAQRVWAKLAPRGPRPSIEWHLATLPNHNLPANRFDVVVSHFFLDCFPTGLLERVVGSLERTATTEASWLITDFRVVSNGWRKWRSLALLNVMYAFFRCTTGIPARRWVCPDPIVQGTGFRLWKRRAFNLGFLHADWWRRGADPTSH